LNRYDKAIDVLLENKMFDKAIDVLRRYKKKVQVKFIYLLSTT
jgi:pentatricopeptide repeat protein